MEIVMALGVPKCAPFLAALALVHLTSTSAIGIRLIAVGSIVTEASVMGAILPANGTDARKSAFAVWVAKGAILLLVLGAGRERLPSCAAISLLPARVRHISVMVVVMEVMDRGAIVVLLCVSEGLLGVMGEVRHVLLIFIVRVVTSMAQWIVILSMDASVVVRAVVEVLRIVVSVMVTVLHLVVRVVMLAIVVHGDVLRLMHVGVVAQIVVNIGQMLRVMVSIKVLNVVVVMVGLLVMTELVGDSMLVIWALVGDFFEMRGVMERHVMAFLGLSVVMNIMV
jgi:hypothetical protein